MATRDPHFTHEDIKQKARYYKTELMMTLFGVNAAAAAGEGSATSMSPVLDISYVPRHSNLVGIGYGAKMANGLGVEGEEAVRVYVRTKLPKSGVSSYELIPSHVDGLSTDVIPIGDIVAARRTVQCGVSTGHSGVTAGTIGCLVKKRHENEYYILSNNHVLADCDRASLGDPILQPGPIDGGNTSDAIAELTDFEPIMTAGVKTMDAAIARMLKPSLVAPEILDIGRVESPPIFSAVYQSVRKCGRTTGHTVGIIMGVDEEIRVRYGKDFVDFDGQLAIHSFRSPFGAGGDSGSLIVDAVSRRGVGLFFATGLNGIGFANEIQLVLDRFGVEIV